MNNKKLFKKPFAYKEAFLFVGVFPVVGFIIELFSDSKGIVMPTAPYNIHILLAVVLVIIFSYLFLLKKSFFKWIATVPVSIATITYTSIIVLLMAFIPQNEQAVGSFANKLGLAHLSRSWPMLLTSFFLLYNLGLVILKRLTKFSVKNIVFILNHLGLWIVVAAGSLGSGDLVRLNMNIWENAQPEWRAQDVNGNVYDLPVAVKLIDFQIEEFNPEIALIDNSNGKIISDDKNKIHMIEVGKEYQLNNMKIKIEKFYELAMRVEGNYVEFIGEGAAPAVKIAVYDKNDNLIQNDWISSASQMMTPQVLWLNNAYSIALLQPAPKKYSSQVELFSKDGTKTSAKIEVNKPFKFKGWKIYQLSYNQDRGRWSELSVIELVRDPWIPVVYIGIFMVLLGSVYLFWIGKKEKK